MSVRLPARRHRFNQMAPTRMRPRLAGAMLGCTLAAAGADGPEDHLQFRWYRLEVIVFERGQADDTVRRLADGGSYPRLAVPLAEANPSDDDRPAFGASPMVEGASSVLVSNLPPPIWLVGDCVARFWEPPPDWSDLDQPMRHDPCQPRPPAPLTAAVVADTEGEGVTAQPEAPAAEAGEDVKPDRAEPTAHELATAALAQAFADHEQALFETGYVWRRRAPGFSAELTRLQRRFNVLAVGTWHQPLPPREEPEPLLVQIGDADENRRFPLEGWFAVTIGRYVHFQVHLQIRLDDNAFALYAEHRRMRSGEIHYLDHPALGIIVRTEPVDIPRPLLDQLARLEELERSGA